MRVAPSYYYICFSAPLSQNRVTGRAGLLSLRRAEDLLKRRLPVGHLFQLFDLVSVLKFPFNLLNKCMWSLLYPVP